LKAEGVGVIKALFVGGRPDLNDAADFIVDGYLVECARGPLPGGNAMTWDWHAARDFGHRHPLVLAGGLSPEKVGEAIAAALPAAIDVSSGCGGVTRAKGCGQGGPADSSRSAQRRSVCTGERIRPVFGPKEIDRMPDREEILVIPHQQLSPEALSGLIEEFVTRDGTDSGYTRGSLAENVHGSPPAGCGAGGDRLR
jgi:hypothetical protein